ALQVRRGGRWSTVDRDRTNARGGYAVGDRRRSTFSGPARLRVSGAGAGVGATTRSLGRLNVYRTAYASWYGPGLYGNQLGCGGTLGAGTLGVAHKTLPCGTKVTLRKGSRSVRVPVIDRGPYVGGREYDLTAATARRIGFGGHGPLLVTR
ncbi:MAG: septal ring lytic transglycosylase RlpA family protein, partial [Actinomycetota bacterium]|nr:septal ring lytic transglycosylase RlpA family protein [Actinomycetota bacterium]